MLNDSTAVAQWTGTKKGLTLNEEMGERCIFYVKMFYVKNASMSMSLPWPLFNMFQPPAFFQGSWYQESAYSPEHSQVTEVTWASVTTYLCFSVSSLPFSIFETF